VTPGVHRLSKNKETIVDKKKPDQDEASKMPDDEDRDYGPYGQQRPDRRSADEFEPEEDDEAPSHRTPPQNGGSKGR
jgi:hypothetical protein